MEVDGAAAPAGSGAPAAVGAFFGAFRTLNQEQRREALVLLNKGMTKDERQMARRVFEVHAPDELSPGAVSKVVKQEMRSLSIAMKGKARI